MWRPSSWKPPAIDDNELIKLLKKLFKQPRKIVMKYGRSIRIVPRKPKVPKPRPPRKYTRRELAKKKRRSRQ